MVVPSLQLDVSQQLTTSAVYGADLVNGALLKFLSNTTHEDKYEKYERSMLQYVLYHNWFAKKMKCAYERRLCPADYFSTVFWIGIAGRQELVIRDVANKSQLNST